jgi:hypothetical protein
MLAVVRLIRESRRYPDGLGFGKKMVQVWRMWRGDKVPTTLDPAEE